MKRPDIRDAKVLSYVEHLEAEIAHMKCNPAFKTYCAVRSQIESWNNQLEVAEDGNNQIDLFADKDVKVFDRAFKYFSEMVALHKNLEELKKMMSPEEVAQTKKLADGGGIAEQLAQKNGQR